MFHAPGHLLISEQEGLVSSWIMFDAVHWRGCQWSLAGVITRDTTSRGSRVHSLGTSLLIWRRPFHPRLHFSLLALSSHFISISSHAPIVCVVPAPDPHLSYSWINWVQGRCTWLNYGRDDCSQCLDHQLVHFTVELESFFHASHLLCYCEPFMVLIQ